MPTRLENLTALFGTSGADLVRTLGEPIPETPMRRQGFFTAEHQDAWRRHDEAWKRAMRGDY
jgi:hypothetical protein